MNPQLLFEFKEDGSEENGLLFCNPVDILATNRIDEIKPIFQKLEDVLSNGYYVAGFVSYEAAPAFDSAYHVQNNPTLPLVWFGVFDAPSQATAIKMPLENYHVSEWTSSLDLAQYTNQIDNIKQAIEEGFTYQVNYTSRLHATFKGDAFALYKQLAANQQASYAAYLDTGNHKILSASPELFFQVRNNQITTKPMKGTAKRGRFLEEDNQFIQQLRNSTKEQAENLMIVDLLRNDIGRIATPGSVQVKKLFEVETYPTVHQMTSTITAQLIENSTVYDWFQALFPCGSITGAPKIKTMEYIAKLEQAPRDVYCGAIGYIKPNRDAIFNVPIRTVIIDSHNETATYGTGGGITWDSTSVGEYEEMFTKARLLTEKRNDFDLLESIKLENGDYPLLPYHINRLKNAADYFHFTHKHEHIMERLSQFASNHTKGTYKVRLTVSKRGEINISGEEIVEISKPVISQLAQTPVDVQNPFLYHKTTNRTIYEKAQEEVHPHVFSALLWNKRRELTEFTIGNLVAEIDGEFYTPPVDCGLLPGTYRNYLVDKGIIKEKILRIDDRSTFDSLWFINSVRGWIQVDWIE